jgi:pSer/pThr/pTyr-binding forkhead associated (FHA) protein
VATMCARLELTVTHGTADRTVYVFEGAPVAIGRGDEVRDHRQRLLRTNQVAFIDGGDLVNQTVSRRHARIESDETGGSYRLFDDGSAHGTSVIRKGRGLQVPRGTRGMRLQSGDEIVLGQARLRLTFGN